MSVHKVVVIGVGCTAFGERWDKSIRHLFVEAAAEAIEDANLSRKDIQAMYIGNLDAGSFVDQVHLAPLLADYLGLNPIPSTIVECACASSGVALRQGLFDIASGGHDVVLVGGVEKMTDVSTGRCTAILANAMDREWEAYQGQTFVGLYALMAKRHMHQYGTRREQLAMVAVKNHKNAVDNPIAQFPRELTVDQCLRSPMVADPLRLFDCSPISDGAAAVILCSAEAAEKYTDTPIVIAGSGQASDTIALHDREDITTLRATIEASRQAYKMAGVEPKEIDVVEVHDCFTIAEIMAYEDLGLCKKGEGGTLIEEGQTEIGGRIPVNPSGGLKAKGHPVGATGAAQAYEIAKQLRGEARKRQIRGAEVGVTHNIGGSGSTAVVHVFKRMDSAKGR